MKLQPDDIERIDRFQDLARYISTLKEKRRSLAERRCELQADLQDARAQAALAKGRGQEPDITEMSVHGLKIDRLEQAIQDTAREHGACDRALTGQHALLDACRDALLRMFGSDIKELLEVA